MAKKKMPKALLARFKAKRKPARKGNQPAALRKYQQRRKGK